MDLIYCDKTFVDKGVLQGYSLDMAYGVDENNFVLITPLETPKLDFGYYIYIDDTECGGIIDGMKVDTKNQTLTYSGRTWQGIMASKIISPIPGDDYYTITGEAHDVIRNFILSLQLDDIFVCEVTSVGFNSEPVRIKPYTVRYNNLYESLIEALSLVGANLMFSVKFDSAKNHNVVKIYVESSANYSALDEFESELLEFKIKKNKNTVNHLYCLGSGELKNRYIISLFTDEYGNVQPYIKPNLGREPLRDADYVISSSFPYRVLEGVDEVSAVYDYPNAQTKDNYTLTTAQPTQWNTIYTDYYTRNEDSEDSFVQNEKNYGTVYNLLEVQPVDFDSMDEVYTRAWDDTDGEWEYTKYSGVEAIEWKAVISEPSQWDSGNDLTNYSNYYTLINGNYMSIQPVDKYSPYPLHTQPADWNTNFSTYYTTDGVSYSPMSAQTVTEFECTKKQPSDWNSYWYNYYTIYECDEQIEAYKLQYAKKEITEEQCEAYIQEYLESTHGGNFGKWMMKLDNIDFYYKMKQKHRVPKWKKKTFGISKSGQFPPNFDENTQYYIKRKGAPDFTSISTGVYYKRIYMQKTWITNTYYTKTDDVEIIPEWKANTYYYKDEDHYADLVENALKKLKELSNIDTLEVELKENDNTYYIGDTISAIERVTGLEITASIVKKIITVERDVLNIRYEVS